MAETFPDPSQMFSSEVAAKPSAAGIPGSPPDPADELQDVLSGNKTPSEDGALPPDDEDEEDDEDASQPGLVDLDEGKAHPVLGRFLYRAVCQTPELIIYLDDRLRIHYLMGAEYGPYPATLGQFMAKAVPLQHRPLDGLSKAHQESYATMIAQAYSFLLDTAGEQRGSPESLVIALGLLDQADVFYSNRMVETSRLWYLISTLLACAFFVLAATTGWLARSWLEAHFGQGSVGTLVAAAGFGSVGAFVSAALRLDEFRVAPTAGKPLHVVESFARVGVGAVAAIAVAMAIQSGILLKDMAGDHHQLLVYFACLIAGSSERVFPNLSAKLPGIATIEERRIEVVSDK